VDGKGSFRNIAAVIGAGGFCREEKVDPHWPYA
jgi:hypothetical protein